jgi:RTX calcium-binding nonapeptide repeat (4 copies)
MAISTNGTVLARLAGGLYNQQLSNASYAEIIATLKTAADVNAFANDLYARDFAGKTDLSVATTLLTNLGLTAVAGLDNWVAAQLTAAGSAKGAKVVELLNGLSGLTADVTYGSYATAFNTKTAAALALSQTDGNNGGDFATAGTAPVSGGTFTLTSGDDTADTVSATRGSLSSTFKFTSGNEEVTGSAGALGGNDVLLDGSTKDSDTLTVTLKNASGTFTAENIETINVATVTGGIAELNLDNVTGTNAINVSGSADLEINGFAADTVNPTIALNGYTRELTIAPDTLEGTTKLETAETINLSVSGTKYGTTAATQSAVVIDGAINGVLETLNITSAGTAANEFDLSFGDDSVSKINVSGSTAVAIRAASADISSVTVTGATGSNVTLKIDVDAGNPNASNYSGVTIALRDSVLTTADAGSVSSLKDGSKVVFLNDFAATTFDVQGATYSALAASIDLTLDNAKAATDVDVANFELQNVKALTVHSLGYNTSSSETAVNSLGDVVGDFTTITIDGDTSLSATLKVDAVQSASGSTGARAVVATAAGMTDGFVSLTAGSSTYVTYTLTGSSGDDTLVANALGNTLNGGEGNDTLTGGNGNDVISGGDGDDTINISYGSTDKVTGGNGDDTFVVSNTSADAVEQISTVTLAAGDWEDETLTVTVDGVNYSVTGGVLATATDVATLFALTWSTALTARKITVADEGDGELSFTAINDGSDTAKVTFSIGMQDTFGTNYADQNNDGTAEAGDLKKTTNTGVAAKDVNTTITDFADTDVIDASGIMTPTSVDLAVGLDEITATSNVILLTGSSYASVALAEAAIVDTGEADTINGLVVFLNSTTGKAQMFYDADLAADDDLTSSDVLFTFDNITTLTGISTIITEDSIAL